MSERKELIEDLNSIANCPPSFGAPFVKERLRAAIEALGSEYTPPPAEGSREWAMEQDCWVRHDSSPNIKVSAQNVCMSVGTPYDNGWTIWKEPRELGWYAGKLNEASLVFPWLWNGRYFITGEKAVVPSDMHWIGSTPIELEQPENEK